MRQLPETAPQSPLLPALRQLEARHTTFPGSSSSAKGESQADVSLSEHSERIFELARKHIASSFPSFWGPIGASRDRVQRKFGTFFREMNLYHFSGPQIGKIVYDDKMIFDAVINRIGYHSPKAVWLVDRSHALRLGDHRKSPLSEVLEEIAAGTYFAKYRTGGGGRGAFLIREGQVTFADGTSAPATPDVLSDIFAESKQNYLLQDVIEQAETLATLNPSSLNTIRCLTYLNRKGEAQVMGATLRLGAGTMVVDNASSGGMFCGIDINRGCLIKTAVNKAETRFTHHPTTGIQFAGYALPELEAVFQMCCRCHEAIGHPMSVGWDVATSPEGPLLLEGNPRWMAKLHTQVDPGVAARMWSAYLDDWGHLDIGFDRAGIPTGSRMRDKHLTLSLKVEGKVQKVGFRRWIARHARERALSGEVRNLKNGSVAIRLSGPTRRVEAMLMLVATGPERAQVSKISVEDFSLTEEDEFTIVT